MNSRTAEAARILVVEDDPKTADLVALYLRHAGHRVHIEHSGSAGMQRIQHESFDLFVLDVMLPGSDGHDLCAEIRTRGDAPVLFLTAQSLEDQRLRGFEIGADDYVTKPFSLRELVARVNALLRRAPAREDTVIRSGPLAIDPAEHRVSVSNQPVRLTPSEFEILRALMERPGRTLTRSQLVGRLPRGSSDPLDRIVDVHVRNIRKKLDQAAAGREHIETVHGVGYRMRA